MENLNFFTIDLPSFAREWLGLAEIRASDDSIKFTFKTAGDRDFLLRRLGARDWQKLEQTIALRASDLGLKKVVLSAKRSNKRLIVSPKFDTQKTPDDFLMQRFAGKVVRIDPPHEPMVDLHEDPPLSFVFAFSETPKGCVARQSGNLVVLDCEIKDVAVDLLMNRMKWMPYLHVARFEKPGLPRIEYAQLALNTVPASLVWKIADFVSYSS